MTKILTRVFALILSLSLFSCNEDNTANDAALTQQLMGKWHLVFTSDNNTSEISYTFDSTKFTYYTTKTSEDGMKVQLVSISGTWNIQKGILQFYYDLDSLLTEGLTAEEYKTVKNDFYLDNTMLSDMNKDGKPYGPTVTFETINGTDAMKLSSINGTFTRY